MPQRHSVSACHEKMGSESEILLPGAVAAGEPPEDRFGITYFVFFVLGTGFLVPWNAFITAVDYFSYLYPGVPVDRVFSVSYMISFLVPLLVLVYFGAHKSRAFMRINAGLALFALALVSVPVMDFVFVRGRRGVFRAYDVTVAATVLCGVADALMQGGVIGAAGELPERYMQATIAGTAASGVLVSAMRVFTKALFPLDPDGLRWSAMVYFAVSTGMMVLCLVCYNLSDRLPVIRHYTSLKLLAVKEDTDMMVPAAWRSTLWAIVGRIKWHGLGLFLIFLVTLSIFPGYVTEDVHSDVLGDWYPIVLIAGYNVFDMAGKALPAAYLPENANVALAGCVARLLFFPLFLWCMHGPLFFRTEMPIAVLTCLLGLTNGYLSAVMFILAPKAVPIQHSENAGMVMVLFLAVGLAAGSLVSWFWVV